MKTLAEISEETQEEMKDALPCDSEGDRCDGNHQHPAQWVFTHPKENGETCTSLQCHPCYLAWGRLMIIYKTLDMDGFRCPCGSLFSKNDVVIRRL